MRDSDGVDGLRRMELVESTSSTDRLLAGTRIGPLAFPGIVPVYGTHLFDRRGRQKISVSWGEQAIDGIKHDSVELVRVALRHKFSNPEERLEAAGPAGAPFSFANAAIFTQEQMDRVVEDLKVRTREINAETKRFVSDSEWLSIDQTLGEIGTYASVFMSRATGGDTGLHIAVALGRLRAAQVFVEEGCDATILNDDGVCVVSILSDNFAKVMELVLRIAQLEEDNSRRVVTGRRLNAKEKACLAQQERVVNRANEYRLFGHGLACYFVYRLSYWRTLQEEERACEIEGREMEPGAELELRLCEVMCRYLEQCEAIRDREHATLPPLTPDQLESKAERFTGVFTPKRDNRGRRRRGRHENGTDGGESRTAPTVGANASLATRMGRYRTATANESDDDKEHEDCAGNGGEELKTRQPRRHGEGRDNVALEDSAEVVSAGNNASVATTSTKFLANATLVSSLSPATFRGLSGEKGVTARITAAQKQASTNLTHNINTNISSTSPSDNSHAKAAVTNTSRTTSIPPPFQGRSLMSAEWISKRGAGAVGRRGQPRYATKGLTPGSWTATEDPNSEGGTGATVGPGSGGGGGSGGDSGVCVGLGSGADCLSSQHGGGGAAASTKRRGGGTNERGLGRGWEGLYQVRPFEDTPDEE